MVRFTSYGDNQSQFLFDPISKSDPFTVPLEYLILATKSSSSNLLI